MSRTSARHVARRSDNAVRETYNVNALTVMGLRENHSRGGIPFRSRRRTSFGRGNGIESGGRGDFRRDGSGSVSGEAGLEAPRRPEMGAHAKRRATSRPARRPAIPPMRGERSLPYAGGASRRRRIGFTPFGERARAPGEGVGPRGRSGPSGVTEIRYQGTGPGGRRPWRSGAGERRGPARPAVRRRGTAGYAASRRGPASRISGDAMSLYCSKCSSKRPTRVRAFSS